MVRVLHCVYSMGNGGIESFIMNIYRNIDRNKIQFDFLVNRSGGKFYEDEIEHLGGKIYVVPARKDGIIKNRKAMDCFFREHHGYSVVHLHESSLSYIEPLKAAKKYGVKIRVIHLHNTYMSNNIIHKLLHRIHASEIDKIATYYLACGELVGQLGYNYSKIKEYTVVYNGIDLKKYAYNAEIRDEVRHNLGINNNLVIGHVGRFAWVKNHTYLLDIFEAVLKLSPDAVLLLVGDGELKREIENKAQTLGIGDNVRFLGQRNDVDKLLQAMDAIVMPSYYEGFPVTAIEAQANGLPILLSDTITKESLIKENAISLSLKDSPEKWAKYILKNLSREIDNQILYNKRYDVIDSVNVLMQIYFS